MRSASGFIAPAFKRYTAFIVDAVATLLIFCIVGVLGEALDNDIKRWVVPTLVYMLHQGGLVAHHQDQTFGRYSTGITVLTRDDERLPPAQAFFRAMVQAMPPATAERASYRG